MTTRTIRRALIQTVALGAALLGLVLVPMGRASAQSGYLFDNFNGGGVSNYPTSPTSFSLATGAHISTLATYHWNNGQGATPGSIALRAHDGTMFGPFTATGTDNNHDWVASTNIDVPAGDFTVVDSDPGTWSTNSQSGNAGFARVTGSATAATTTTSNTSLNTTASQPAVSPTPSVSHPAVITSSAAAPTTTTVTNSSTPVTTPVGNTPHTMTPCELEAFYHVNVPGCASDGSGNLVDVSNGACANAANAGNSQYNSGSYGPATSAFPTTANPNPSVYVNNPGVYSYNPGAYSYNPGAFNYNPGVYSQNPGGNYPVCSGPLFPFHH